MRAVLADGAGGPEVLTVTQVDRPDPGPHEVRIKVAAAGINRADVMQRKGHYPPPPGASEVLGLEVSGHIDAVGSEVRDWDEGQECVALLAGGGYAEYVVVDAEHILPPPEGLDLIAAGGFIEVAATVISNMDVAALTGRDTFLVHGGAGGIGSFAIQYAKSLGCKVITTAGRPEKLELCRSMGADLALSYNDDWVGAVRDAGGVDVILDSVGAKYLSDHVDLMNKDGRMVVIGLQKGRKGELDLGKLLNKRAHISATSLRSRPADQKARIVARVHEMMHHAYANGTLRPVPVRSWPLDEVSAAHEFFDSGEHQGKLILQP